MAVYKHFAYWMPSKKAGENSMKFYTECIVNMPVEKDAGQTFLELYILPGGKNRIRKLLSNIPYINDILSVLDRVSSVKMQNRLIISYIIGGGLLNVFNDDVSEEYDEVWKDISKNGTDTESAVKWNMTPNNLFSMLTPEEVWACPGVEERKLFDEFFEDLTKKFDGKGFEYEGEMLTQAIFFLRGWVFKKSLFSKPPIEIIKEERRQNAVKNKKILGII
ncbi:hypothetical protein C4544_03600 [candidate division WS5 bacterium]|uniref:Uncharacterized protein n=1 Tax=candidate division WS5 bacterium TaxID=2093353 RepID=A0A419DDE5_9BACT|nr:MAG: hypothetical protein C4544_03600 [candidate division WS5 bacterium]